MRTRSWRQTREKGSFGSRRCEHSASGLLGPGIDGCLFDLPAVGNPACTWRFAQISGLVHIQWFERKEDGSLSADAEEDQVVFEGEAQ